MRLPHRPNCPPFRYTRRVFDELDVEAIVVTEDDLMYSVDFFDYMCAANDFLADSKGGDSPWTASAWNDNGFVGRVRNESAVRLTTFFPGLGWLLRREVWDGLRAEWPDDHWDHFIRERSSVARRPVIHPEVPRTYHAGSSGTFMCGAAAARGCERIPLLSPRSTPPLASAGASECT